jgi:hypothetical protein
VIVIFIMYIEHVLDQGVLDESLVNLDGNENFKDFLFFEIA